MGQLSKYRYVSFDIFDTLIKRSVAKPTDLFRLIEINYDQIRRCKSGFEQKRIIAEQNARRELNRPITLEEIYEKLRKEFGHDADKLKEMEVHMEIEGCQPNPPYVKMMNQCLEEGKTVVLISDMYLSSDIVKTMLEKCGIKGYHRLYISCEWNARKADGSLFRKVLEDLNLFPYQMVHVGDNLRSDYIMPISMGVQAKWIRNDQKQMCKVPDTISSKSAFIFRTLQSCIRNCSAEMNEWEYLGCKTFGPLLYGFSQWLIKQLSKDDIQDVYFLARDGFMLQRAFEKFNIKGIRIHYLLCSRRSYQVPLIWRKPAFEDVILPLCQIDKMSLRIFMKRIGLDPQKYINQIYEKGLSLDYVYKNRSFYSAPEIREFYQEIQEDVIQNSKIEYDGLLAYLQSQNFEDKIAVVDIGYQGSMQYALSSILQAEGKNISVMGYYVNVDTDSPLIREGKVNAKGYIHDSAPFNMLKKRGVQKGLFEIQFLESHGSTHRFMLKGKDVEIEYAPFEYERNNSSKVDEMTIISDYQSGALSLVEYMLEHFKQGLLEIPTDVALCEFIRFSTKPTVKEATTLGDFRFYGSVQTYVACPQKISTYLLHPKLLKSDFLKSIWRTGFLRRLVRIPLPYDRILHLLYCID